MRSVRRTAVICWVALSIPLVLPLLTGRVFARGDFVWLHLPLRRLYSEALTAGDSVLWSPALFSGAYIFAEGQTGMAHPFHRVLYRLLPLPIAFNLELVSTYPFAGGGMYLLLRRWMSREAALIGAMLFAFSGFNLIHLAHMNAIAVIAHLPWALWSIEVMLSTSSARERAAAFAGLVLVIASQILLGFPQFIWMTVLAVGSFVLWRLWNGVSIRQLPIIGAAFPLATAVGAVQLLPTAYLASHSVRASPTVQYLLLYSLPPVSLAQLWSPYAFAAVDSELAIYDGVFCTVALAWLVVRWRAFRRRDALIMLLAFASANALLAFGRYGGVAALLVAVPGIGLLRAPARYIVLVHAALAALGAIVFDDVARMVRRGERIPLKRLWPLAIPLVLSIVTAAAAAMMADTVSFTTFSPHGPMLSGLRRSIVGVALMGTAVLLFVLASSGRRWAVSAFVVLIAVDLGLWGYRDSYRPMPPQAIDTIYSRIPLPQQAKPGEYLSAGQTNLPVLRGMRLSAGYLGLEARTAIDRQSDIGSRLAGVSWRLDGQQWSRVPDTMPRARLVVTVRNTRHVAEDVAGLDIGRVALIQSAIPPLSGAPGDARVLTDRPGRIVVRTTAPATQLLVLTERYDEGWRATEGDRQCPVLPVYADYLGCVVSSGTHDIVFTFAPASFRNGLRLTLAGLVLTAVVTWVLATTSVGVVPARSGRTRRRRM
jgi:hypothetical protein